MESRGKTKKKKILKIYKFQTLKLGVADIILLILIKQNPFTLGSSCLVWCPWEIQDRHSEDGSWSRDHMPANPFCDERQLSSSRNRRTRSSDRFAAPFFVSYISRGLDSLISPSVSVFFITRCLFPYLCDLASGFFSLLVFTFQFCFVCGHRFTFVSLFVSCGRYEFVFMSIGIGLLLLP